jgi:hypothetical protein
MPDAPLAIRQKVEAATKAYLVARIAAAGADSLTGVDLKLRQEITDIKFPRVLLEAPRAPAFEGMNELYMCDLMAALATEALESPVATVATRHATRIGLLAEWLADRASFLAYVNEGRRPWIDPEPAPIDPPVPDLVIHDILLEDEQGEQTGDHWLDVLSYLVPAQLKSSA